MTVLIVDDEYYIAQSVLTGIDWRSVGVNERLTAYSMKQAQEAMTDNNVDILIADVEMPQGSGLDLIEWSNQRGFSPVKIILTGHTEFPFVQKALRLGCMEYISKPIDFKELLAAVKKAIDMRIDGNADVELSFVVKVKRFIKDKLGDEALNREVIAAEFHVNTDYLSFAFHKQSGETLNGYITRKRIEKAKRFLDTTEMSLQDISDATGFSTSSYFHRRFKEVTGVTPTQYKRGGIYD